MAPPLWETKNILPPPFSSSTATLRAMSMLLLAVILASLMLGLTVVALPPLHAQTLGGGLPSLIWPLSGSATPDTVSSPFGPRWQASQSRYDYHPGIDLPAPQNTPVHVITDGVVSEVGWLSPSAGLAVVVYHPSLNLYSAYLHLNSTAVVQSQTVTQGQVIGYSGDTGITTFQHLHFEIRLTATSYPTSTRNPMGYLPRPDVSTPTLQITNLTADPIYSPTVSVAITVARAELDMNAITVTLQDRATGAVVDEKVVNFNRRLPTGADTLTADGVELQPAHFNTSTVAYALTANFAFHGADAFTLTAQAADLAGHTATVTATADDTTPPARIDSLVATRRQDGGVDLRWTAPGDSDMVGTADAYDIRYDSAPIDSFSWFNATPITSPPSSLWGGPFLPHFVPPPLPDPVYFAIKTRDREGNLSLLSNSAPAGGSQKIFLPLVIK